MTEILQLTTDKPEFSNFVNDTLVLNKNSKVCLNKASFSVPIIVNRHLRLPLIFDPDDYDEEFFKVFLNGIEHSITFQNFFDNYLLIDDFNQPTIAEFYDGSYQLWLDNIPLIITNDGITNDSVRMPTFSDVLVRCCNTKFFYYDFYSEDIYENSTLNDIYSGFNFTVGTQTATQFEELRNLQRYKISAFYNPRQITNDLAPDTMNWENPDIISNFTASGDGITATTTDPAMGSAPNTFDPNGGWVSCLPNIVGGKAAMGIVFQSKGHDDPLNVTGVYQPENFDVGIEWYLDAGVYTFRIIDGHNHFVYSHGGSVQEDDVPHYQPPNKIFTFDNQSDYFYLLVKRGRPMNGTTEFITTIIQSHNTTDITGPDNRVIYVAKSTLNTSQVRIQTLAYSDGGLNELDHWRYIEVCQDSRNEDNYLNDDEDTFKGIKSSQSFGIIPNTNFDTSNFFTHLGISGNEYETALVSVSDTNTYNKSISWAVPKNIPKDYFIGYNNIGDVLEVINTPGYLVYKDILKVVDIPRQIEFSLMDTTINPRAGNFISTNNIYDTSSFNKVVNYIQTDKEDLDIDESGNIDYVYEAFNLVYRKLENIQKLPITQMKAKLGYKDFRTNQELVLKKIDGVAKFEILFDSD